METLFDGYRAQVEGKYHFEGSKLFLDPSHTDVQGAGTRLQEIKGMVSQPARVTVQFYSPHSFRVGVDDPPLVVNKMSPNP
jgi:hypothetical protein